MTQPHPFRPALEPLEDRTVPASLPAGFTESAVASGLTNPTAMEFSPDGRLFVDEQAGTLKVFQNGALVQSNFFRDTPLTVSSEGERGLLGIAFDPAYTTDHFVYVYYTATTPAVHNRVSRFTADAAGDLALAGSEKVILELPNLGATNHNGGAIHFGPDGKLYVAVGENAVADNAQSLSTPLGKMLRINADGSIPSDNPFVNTPGANPAIWALGLRNPFTFAFQPGTGRMFINDVGASSFEEIDEGVAGANYGWPITEGPTSDPRFKGPLYSYDHSQGQVITGGAFYNPAVMQFPADYAGDYFFADFAAGFIRRIDPVTKQVSTFATNASGPVDLKVDGAGNLYYLARTSGSVFQVHYVSADLSVSASAPAVRLGQPLSYTLTVKNNGPDTTAGVVLTASLPSAAPFTSASASQGTFTQSGTNVTFNLGSLGSSQQASITLVTSPQQAGTLTATFAVTGSLPDVNAGNNSTEVDTRVSTGPVTPPVATVGEFDPATATWYLRNSNSAGAPDFVPFAYGAPGWVGVVGDWDGDGVATVGVYDPATATWYLRNSNSAGAPSITPFAFGAPGWVPVVGDWDGNGTVTIGVVDPATMTWYLRNSNSAGAPDAGQFRYGLPGWRPVVGDWTGEGVSGIGAFDPSSATWYLRNEPSGGAADAGVFAYGLPGWLPVTGDWNGDRRSGIGVIDPTSATWYQRNAASAGAADSVFAYGFGLWVPVAGNYAG